MPRLLINIPPGTQYGRLTVLSSYQPAINTPWRCVVACECGVVKAVNKSNLLAGKANSCGCLQRELSSKRWKVHGHSTGKDGKRSPTYISWHGMKDRILNPKEHDRPTYEKVDMDPRWHDFTNFLADMGERPEGTTIDRIDGTKGYWPDNCRWATQFEQSQNRRKPVHSPEGAERIRQATIARHAANRAAKLGIYQERT